MLCVLCCAACVECGTWTKREEEGWKEEECCTFRPFRPFWVHFKSKFKLFDLSLYFQCFVWFTKLKTCVQHYFLFLVLIFSFEKMLLVLGFSFFVSSFELFLFSFFEKYFVSLWLKPKTKTK